MNKKCNCCNQIKDLDDFYKDKHSPDGKTYRCKDCAKAKRKQYRQNNYQACLEKERKQSLNYYYQNQDERKQTFKEYYQEMKEERKDFRQDASRKYYEENREHVKEKHREWDINNPERRREISADYYKRNPHVRIAQNAKRRASLQNRTPSWANPKKIREIYAEAKRLESEDGILRHVDHIVPLNGKEVSGLHVEGNLQILTAKENLQKSNKIEL